MKISALVVAVALVVCCCATADAQDAQIRDIAQKMSAGLTANGKKTVAAVDFTDLQGCVTELGRYMAEEFSTTLAQQGASFQVIDRTNLAVIMRENHLAAKGILDPSVTQKLGQIAGVDALLTGTLTPLGDTVHLSVKALDAATARIVAAAEGDIPRTKAINDLLAQSVSCTGTGSDPGSDSAPSLKTSSFATGQIKPVTVYSFKFELQACKRNQDSVTCRFFVTNTGDDRNIWVDASTAWYGRYDPEHISKLYDNLGNIYIAKAVQIANQHVEETMDWHEFPSNLTTPVTLRFDNISPQATSVGLLEINCYPQSFRGDAFRINFRGIPIQ